MADPANRSRPVIRALAGADEARACARLMVQSEPWITLGRSEAAALGILEDPGREVHVLVQDEAIAGFVILDLRGPLRGYVQSVCVAPERRGRGLGTQLVRWAEERIFRESPNVFLCVSSFNDGARRLYERLGYEAVGRLEDHVVRGHAEILLRKSRGPWTEFATHGTVQRRRRPSAARLGGGGRRP
jgi:ribosomal protein S18 acetylase RimI-like enzyme